ncbi:hypothetical protein GQ42DRAFT_162211 [Ramicandelaber brevisporus]|nr:hypothetical protein GQ42DRAFT_162211 [Ramicandelaber brevisporus]
MRRLTSHVSRQIGGSEKKRSSGNRAKTPLMYRTNFVPLDPISLVSTCGSPTTIIAITAINIITTIAITATIASVSISHWNYIVITNFSSLDARG